MKTPSNHHIELMDNVLNFYKKYNSNEHKYFSEKVHVISSDEFNYIISKICLFDVDSELLVTYNNYPSGRYIILKLTYIGKQFIINGGFREYYNKQTELNSLDSQSINYNITSIVGNNNSIQSSQSSNKDLTPKNTKNPIKKGRNFIIWTLSIIAMVIATLVAMYIMIGLGWI